MGKIRIAIIGAGNMGTAMAHALAGNGHEIRLWDFFPEVVEDISKNRINGRFLPGIRLHENIHATADHSECVTGAELVIVCVPSAFVIPSFTPVIPFLAKNAVILNAAKGFAPGCREPMPVKLATLTPITPSRIWPGLSLPMNSPVEWRQLAKSPPRKKAPPAGWRDG